MKPAAQSSDSQKMINSQSRDQKKSLLPPGNLAPPEGRDAGWGWWLYTALQGWRLRGTKQL